MAINGSLDGLKKDVLKNLSKDKLKSYIFNLTKKYYVSFIEGDEDAFNSTIEHLHDVINEYSHICELERICFLLLILKCKCDNDKSKLKQ